MVSGAHSGLRLGLPLLLACLGCETRATAPSAPGTAGSPAIEPSSCSEAVSPGPSPIRRLNRFEYNNTVLALLDDSSQPASLFPPEESGNGFGNDATALSAPQLLVERYALAAQQLAQNATSQERFVELVGCEPLDAAEELDCTRAFIERFGQRAFRGPVTEGEVGRFSNLFETSRAGREFPQAIADVIAVMLQSPRFLYRVELDGEVSEGTNVATLTPYEMASRLSYLFLGSMPDAELFELAARGELQTPESVRAQAERLLQDERSHHTVQHFHTSLFGLSGLDYLSRSSDAYPTFTPDLGPLFRRETETFLDYAVWQDDGKLSTLMSAEYTFLNARLAEFYGVSGPSGEAFEKVQLDPAQRAGFLTQAGPMAALTPGASTNPVIRGVFLRSRLFCDPPPDPPADLMVEEPAAGTAPTARERFEKHRVDATCNACHALIDPLGLPFENYDGLGQWRETENGEPIDARGDLVGTDVAGPVEGPVELVRRVAQSGDARRCYANQWMSYAYGRGFSEADACTRERVETEFSRAEGGIQELLLALTQTDAFLYRSVEGP